MSLKLLIWPWNGHLVDRFRCEPWFCKIAAKKMVTIQPIKIRSDFKCLFMFSFSVRSQRHFAHNNAAVLSWYVHIYFQISIMSNYGKWQKRYGVLISVNGCLRSLVEILSSKIKRQKDRIQAHHPNQCWLIRWKVVPTPRQQNTNNWNDRLQKYHTENLTMVAFINARIVQMNICSRYLEYR